MSADAKRIVLARIGAAHGIRGEVRVKTFTADPAAIADYGDLVAADGRVFTIEAARAAGGSDGSMLVVRFAGIADRNAAEALNGTELSVDRANLPDPEEEDEFYATDLVGMEARDLDGQPLGKVKDVVNYGAGDILEIAIPGAASILVPFSKTAVPEIDLAARTLVVIPPVFDVDTGD